MKDVSNKKKLRINVGYLNAPLQKHRIETTNNSKTNLFVQLKKETDERISDRGWKRSAANSQSPGR